MACLAEIFGEFKFKDYARLGGWENFTQGLAGYAGVIFFLIRSLRVERLNSTWQYIGLALLIAGLFLVRMGGISR